MSNTTKEKIVVGGALVGGILFFGFLTGTCSNPLHKLDSGSSSDSTASSSQSNDLSAIDNEVHSQLDTTSADSEQHYSANLERLQQENTSLRSKLASALRKQNDSARKLAKLAENQPITLDQEQLDYAREELQKQIDFYKVEASENINLRDQLTSLKSTNTDLKTKIKSMNDRLSKAMANAEKSPADVNNAQLTTDLNSTIKDLTKQNAQFQADIQVKNININDLKKTLDAFKTHSMEQNQQIDTLNATLNQLKAQKNVFAKSADDLPDTAKALFTDIKNLEGKSRAEIATAYKNFTKDHQSNAKARIKFSSGKSTLSPEDIAKIKQLTAAAGENAYFLVVGFADKSGSAASNETLSSKRSTAVAKELANNVKGLQAAQAVYFGQTSRFGAAAENRVVEIWQIK